MPYLYSTSVAYKNNALLLQNAAEQSWFKTC